MSRLKDFYKYKTFFSLLRITKKYNELFFSHEAKLTSILSIITIILIVHIYFEIPDAKLADVLKNLLNILIPALIGLLGFIIAGVTLMATIISKEALKRIDEINKIEKLAGILYSFYFEGFIIGINIMLMIYIYLVLYIPMIIDFNMLLIILIIMSYVFWFAIIYAITLLGTCINFFFMNIYYSDK